MTNYITLQKFYNAKMAENTANDGKYEIRIDSMNGYMHFLKFQTTDVPVTCMFVVFTSRKLYL